MSRTFDSAYPSAAHRQGRRADAANAMTAVIAALKTLGIATPTSRRRHRPPTPVRLLEQRHATGHRYTFSNGVAVTVRKLELLGDAINSSLAAGATSLDSVSFRSTTRRRPRQARTAAIADAKAKAMPWRARPGVTSRGWPRSPRPSRDAYPVYTAWQTGGQRPTRRSRPGPPARTSFVTVSVVYLIPSPTAAGRRAHLGQIQQRSAERVMRADALTRSPEAAARHPAVDVGAATDRCRAIETASAERAHRPATSHQRVQGGADGVDCDCIARRSA